MKSLSYTLLFLVIVALLLPATSNAAAPWNLVNSLSLSSWSSGYSNTAVSGQSYDFVITTAASTGTRFGIFSRAYTATNLPQTNMVVAIELNAPSTQNVRVSISLYYQGNPQVNSALVYVVGGTSFADYTFLFPVYAGQFDEMRFNFSYLDGETGTREILVDNIRIDGTLLDNCDNPLPIQLATFQVASVVGSDVTLYWKTLSETNNYGFDVERSSDGKNFQKLSFIAGHGTTLATHEYSYEDKSVAVGTWYYRLKQTDLDGSATYSEVQVAKVEGVATVAAPEVPTVYSLRQNYPNPFNPATKIEYALPAAGRVTLKVYDALGREVVTLVEGMQTAGSHTATFDATSLPSGTYFYRIGAGTFTATHKMLLLK